MRSSLLLQADDISFSYGRIPEQLSVLSRVSLSVFSGELVAIVGPSGCGKSTLLRLMAGLHSPDEGEVGWRIPKSDSAFVFQEPTLLPWRSVRANALFGVRSRRRVDQRTIEFCEELLQAVDLYEFAKAYPSVLSVGMQQRVSLVRALTCRPSILFLDEAMASSDYIMRLKIERLLNDRLESGSGIVMVSHDLDDCLRLADRLVVLSRRPASIRRTVAVACPRSARSSDEGAIVMKRAREEVLDALTQI